MKLSEITPNAKNPRLIKEERFKKLVRSLENLPDFTAIRAIILDEDKKIIGGNMRFRAMQHLKWKWAIVQVYDREYHAETEAALELGKSYEDVCREMVIRDNVSFGQDDFDILANEYDPLELDEWGLDVWQPEEEETEGLTDPDEVPEAPEEAKTKLGDLYILGNHRLLCGDSTKAEDVEKLMNGENADFVYMDPPYGMRLNTNYATTSKVKGKSYKPVEGDFEDFDPSWHLAFFASAREQFWWGADYYCQMLPKEGSWIVWDKKKEDLDESIGSGFELCWSLNSHKRQIARFLWSGFTAKESNEQRQHPTQKPIGLAEWFFERWGKVGDIVVDLYGGSGTTLIACDKTSRYCRMMELDPKYCDVIVKRWEDFTGKKASKQ